MTGPVIVPDPTTVRGPIESEHNATRDAREKKYVTDRVALETAYHSDLASIAAAKSAAYVAAGLNPDGSTPTTYGGDTPPTLPDPGSTDSSN
jgi:hypothetical protein